METRFDPACSEARALDAKHRTQSALLASGEGGRLDAVLQQTQARQRAQHAKGCDLCRHYDPRCVVCGFEPARERHGWMCPAQTSRWADVLPWNWRARHAPEDHAPPAREAPAPRPSRTATPPPGTARAKPDPRASAPRPPPRPAKPPPRARPGPPAPLAAAYAALGLPSGASESEVRAAYRRLASQYHPDKVSHLGPELRALAGNKMADINAAYERIRKALA